MTEAVAIEVQMDYSVARSARISKYLGRRTIEMIRNCILLMCLCCTPVFAQNGSTMPPGWGRTGDNPGGYDFMIDTSQKHGGKASVSIMPKPTAVNGKFGSLVQAVRPDEYRGKRIRFSGYVKTENIGEFVQL